jgi:hypothetical protein
MRRRWKPFPQDGEITFNTPACFVARYIKDGNGNAKVEVTLPYLGWNWANNRIFAVMNCPHPFAKDRSEWRSEFWGDELPSKSGPCLGVIIDKKTNATKRGGPVYYSKPKEKFVWIQPDEEVVAWFPFPDPPKEVR